MCTDCPKVCKPFQVLLIVLYVVAASSLAFQLPKAGNELFFSTCEWIVYVFVAISVVICVDSVYREVKLKMLSVAAEHTLPSELRSIHRTVVQWVLRRTATGGRVRQENQPTNMPRRVSISNRGNMIPRSLVTIFRSDSLRELVNSDVSRARFLTALSEVSVPQTRTHGLRPLAFPFAHMFARTVPVRLLAHPHSQAIRMYGRKLTYPAYTYMHDPPCILMQAPLFLHYGQVDDKFMPYRERTQSIHVPMRSIHVRTHTMHTQYSSICVVDDSKHMHMHMHTHTC